MGCCWDRRAGREGWGWLWGELGVSQKEESQPHTFPVGISPAGVTGALLWLSLGCPIPWCPRFGVLGGQRFGVLRADVSL